MKVTNVNKLIRVYLVDSNGHIWANGLFKRWPRKIKKLRKRKGLTLEIPITGFNLTPNI